MVPTRRFGHVSRLTIVPKIRISSVTVTEGNAGTLARTFVVTLTAAPTLAITVQYATQDILTTTALPWRAPAAAR